MKIKKSLTSFFFLIFGFLALMVSSCAFAFALAITIRCLIRAWHAGWTMFAVLLASSFILHPSSLLAAPLGTPIYFPQIGTTGAANSRDIMVIPDPSSVPLVYASNLVAFQTLLLHPIHGGTTNYLLPWGYTLRVDGMPSAAHIVVPISTNVINVVSLITNALAIGYPISSSGSSGAATNISNATGTNVAITDLTAGSVVTTNLVVNDADGNAAADFVNRILYRVSGGQERAALDWQNGTLSVSPAAEPNITLNWVTRTLFGDWTATNITATGTISANQFIGDGSQLTSIPASSVTGLGTAALMETNKFLGTNIVVNESSSPSSATVDATGKATFNIRTNAPSPTTMVWQPTFNRAISSAATGAGGPLRTSKNYGGFQAQPQGTGASGAVAGVTNGTFKFKHWATGNMTAIRLVYGNSCGNSKNTNAITVQSTVELASGTLIPVFFNGQRSATIQGGAFVTSDPLGITMLKGTNIFSRTYVEVTTTNQGFPLWLYPVNDASHSGEGYSFATNIVDDVSAKYVYASFLEGYGPTVIQGLAPSTNAAIAIFGDSIAVGAGNLDNYGNNSYVESGLSNPAGDRKFNGDWFNHANLAEGSASFDTDTYDVQAFKWRGSEGCNIALVEHGVNNISVGDSFSTITNKMIQFWNSQVAVGRKVFQLTIPPRTTGTYTTVNGQTPWDAAKEGVRTNLNIWLLTQPAPLSGVFDVTTNCTATNASGQLVWRANYTLDGVHPSYLSISWSNMGNSIIQSQFK